MLERRACASVRDEQRNTDVMLPVALFKSSNCVVADAVTFSLLSTLAHTRMVMFDELQGLYLDGS